MRLEGSQTAPDPFHLHRFVEAQAPVWDSVRAELLAGGKQTHWMWFVFPQLACLGRSSTARFYGISGPDEARAYVDHPVLGPRLMECCQLLMQARSRSAVEIFGSVDAMKLRSCLTLFEAVAPAPRGFAECIEVFFAGQRDPLTRQALDPRDQ
ncbi:MAG TPA: DUF1810 domain-containing protein [Ramlibacter sp.]|jgi:uncharacterized protein (DUF1810 family)|nr:DUF1810 domain-containing protein [Ramlibacter sp.]